MSYLSSCLCLYQGIHQVTFLVIHSLLSSLSTTFPQIPLLLIMRYLLSNPSRCCLLLCLVVTTCPRSHFFNYTNCPQGFWYNDFIHYTFSHSPLLVHSAVELSRCSGKAQTFFSAPRDGSRDLAWLTLLALITCHSSLYTFVNCIDRPYSVLILPLFAFLRLPCIFLHFIFEIISVIHVPRRF